MKVTVEVTKTQTEEVDIDVSCLDREWKWLAVDKNGHVWVYRNKPSISNTNNEWDLYPLSNMKEIDRIDDWPIENWKNTLVEINHLLPVGTLLILDSEVLTGGSCNGLIIGVITSTTRDTWPYECKCLRNGEGSYTQSVRESAIVAAYDPVTHEQLI